MLSKTTKGVEKEANTGKGANAVSTTIEKRKIITFQTTMKRKRHRQEVRGRKSILRRETPSSLRLKRRADNPGQMSEEPQVN